MLPSTFGAIATSLCWLAFPSYPTHQSNHFKSVLNRHLKKTSMYTILKASRHKDVGEEWVFTLLHFESAALELSVPLTKCVVHAAAVD